MKVEIIAIGDELTSGRIPNTTSGFAARHLFDAGYEIYAIHTIGDTPDLIGEALKRAIKRVDIVIVTGGLGTTDDDLTNEAVSQALNRPTLPNMAILAQIRKHLDNASDTSTPESPLEKLAWLPRGAEALNPKEKMAGYQLVHNSRPIFFLPGVPSQMEYLLIKYVLPRLAIWYNDPSLRVRKKMLRIFNMEETEVNEKITSLKLDNAISVGYYPVFPELHITLTVRGLSHSRSLELINDATHRIQGILGHAIYGEDNNTLESIVGGLLKDKQMTLALAESCTGGLISSKITKVPGISSYYLGGVTSYSNEMKEKFLQVDRELLDRHGAVSYEVARAMATNVRKLTGADIGLSITGIAGPGGGSENKPVGTVYICLALKEEEQTVRYQFLGKREQIQEITAITALDTLRRHLQNLW